jgi:hypothetical protein
VTISQADIYTLAIGAGLTPARAKTAAAVAMAESGGDPNAHNTTGPDNSYGLWQINMKGSLGPARIRQLNLASADDLFSPQVNAHAMAVISHNGTNFLPWSTFTDGAYLTHLGANVGTGTQDAGFLQRLKDGAGGLLGLAVPGVGALGDIGGVIKGFEKTAAWVSNSQNWVRVGYVLGGAILVIVGTTMVLRDTSAGRAVSGAAGGAANVATGGEAGAVRTALKKESRAHAVSSAVKAQKEARA